MKCGVGLLLGASVCLAGCASLYSDQHARELADNHTDDEYCNEHGLRYPDPGYVQCRRGLVDRRLYRESQSLNLMQHAGQPAVNPASPSPALRDSNPADFHCHAEPQFGDDYVFCGYDSGVPGP